MNSFVRNLLTASFITGTSCAFGQSVVFQNTYTHGNSSHARSVVQTSDSAYVITGSSDGNLLVAKIDKQGANTIWSYTYGGPGDDIGRDIQLTSDGGFIITGGYGSAPGNENIYLLKLDAAGAMQWSQTITSTNSDIGNAVRETSDGGYIVAGYGYSVTSPYRMKLIKTDASGNIQWQQHYYTHYLFDVRETADGGFMVFGTRGNGANGFDVVMFKTDNAGNEVWTQNYGTANIEYSRSFTPTYDGGYAFVNMVNGVPHLIKVDASGSVIFDKTNGLAPYWDNESNIIETPVDSGFIMAGRRLANDVCMNDSTPAMDIYIVKTNKNGDTLWTRTIGASQGLENGFSIQNTSDKGYIIAGYRSACGTESSNVYLVKIGRAGSVAALSELNANAVRVFPNPMTESASIRFDPSMNGRNIRLELYDNFGQLVKKIAQVENNELILSKGELKSGVYLYRVKESEIVISTGKLVVE